MVVPLFCIKILRTNEININFIASNIYQPTAINIWMFEIACGFYVLNFRYPAPNSLPSDAGGCVGYWECLGFGRLYPAFPVTGVPILVSRQSRRGCLTVRTHAYFSCALLHVQGLLSRVTSDIRQCKIGIDNWKNSNVNTCSLVQFSYK